MAITCCAIVEEVPKTQHARGESCCERRRGWEYEDGKKPAFQCIIPSNLHKTFSLLLSPTLTSTSPAVPTPNYNPEDTNNNLPTAPIQMLLDNHD